MGLSLLRFIPTKVKNTLLNLVWPFQDFEGLIEFNLL